jgi:biopolymer transport protein ExbB
VIDAALRFVEAGGPIVAILAALSLVSVALIAVKLVDLIPARSDPALREAALESWSSGARAAARSRIEEGRGPADRTLGAAMAVLAAGGDAEAARAEMERVGAGELAALSRYLRLLDVIAATSPLLGLLGTVLGMIQAFRDLELAGGGANAAALAGGIWQALLTTAMGLIVAIPAGAAAGLMAARVDRIGREIEDAGARLLASARAS